jgi:WhiB family transcriptional regulator, redox-sensing transcriptional regulator
MRVPPNTVGPEPPPSSRIAWRHRAACRGFDPNLFVPRVENHEQVTDAVAICAGCDVSAECLVEALADPRLVGVWGGLTTQERRELRRERRQASVPHDRLTNTKITTAATPIASTTIPTAHASALLTL